ncbi:MAG: hypothetical protein C4337_06325, partial [Armatimonadota bacterium]
GDDLIRDFIVRGHRLVLLEKSDRGLSRSHDPFWGHLLFFYSPPRALFTRPFSAHHQQAFYRV